MTDPNDYVETPAEDAVQADADAQEQDGNEGASDPTEDDAADAE